MIAKLNAVQKLQETYDYYDWLKEKRQAGK